MCTWLAIHTYAFLPAQAVLFSDNRDYISPAVVIGSETETTNDLVEPLSRETTELDVDDTNLPAQLQSIAKCNKFAYTIMYLSSCT